MFGEPFTATHGNASSVSGVGDNQLVSQILTPGSFRSCNDKDNTTVDDPSNYKLRKSTKRVFSSNEGTTSDVNIFEAASPVACESPRPSSAKYREKVPTSPTHVAEIDVFDKEHFEQNHFVESEYDDNGSSIHNQMEQISSRKMYKFHTMVLAS